jgi:hypothetical protein
VLINKNHAHLVNLGVSHPSLEAIRAKTASEPYKLSTKLTGAGGGGCAVTLLPDSEPRSWMLRTLAETILLSSQTSSKPTLRNWYHHWRKTHTVHTSLRSAEVVSVFYPHITTILNHTSTAVLLHPLRLQHWADLRGPMMASDCIDHTGLSSRVRVLWSLWSGWRVGEGGCMCRRGRV